MMLFRFVCDSTTAAVHPAIKATLSSTVYRSLCGRAVGVNNSARQLGATSGGLVANGFRKRAVFSLRWPPAADRLRLGA